MHRAHHANRKATLKLQAQRFYPILTLFFEHDPPSKSNPVFAGLTLAPSSTLKIDYVLWRFWSVTFTKQRENWSTWVCQRERQKILPPWQREPLNKRKHSLGVLAMPLPHHDEMYGTARGSCQMAGQCVYVCVWTICVSGGGVCVRAIFLWWVERGTVPASVPFSFM